MEVLGMLLGILLALLTVLVVIIVSDYDTANHCIKQGMQWIDHNCVITGYHNE